MLDCDWLGETGPQYHLLKILKIKLMPWHHLSSSVIQIHDLASRPGLGQWHTRGGGGSFTVASNNPDIYKHIPQLQVESSTAIEHKMCMDLWRSTVPAHNLLRILAPLIPAYLPFQMPFSNTHAKNLWYATVDHSSELYAVVGGYCSYCTLKTISSYLYASPTSLCDGLMASRW